MSSSHRRTHGAASIDANRARAVVSAGPASPDVARRHRPSPSDAQARSGTTPNASQRATASV